MLLVFTGRLCASSDHTPTGLTANLLGVLSPYVEVEIIGCEEDMANTNKHTTKVIRKKKNKYVT